MRSPAALSNLPSLLGRLQLPLLRDLGPSLEPTTCLVFLALSGSASSVPVVLDVSAPLTEASHRQQGSLLLPVLL